MGVIEYTKLVVDEFGNEVERKFKKAVCDYCGKLIFDEGEKFYEECITVGENAYHVRCYVEVSK